MNKHKLYVSIELPGKANNDVIDEVYQHFYNETYIAIDETDIKVIEQETDSSQGVWQGYREYSMIFDIKTNNISEVEEIILNHLNNNTNIYGMLESINECCQIKVDSEEI